MVIIQVILVERIEPIEGNGFDAAIVPSNFGTVTYAVVDRCILADDRLDINIFARRNMRKSESQNDTSSSMGFNKERVGTFNGMRAIELCADRLGFVPCHESTCACPKKEVVNEMGHRVSETGIKNDSVVRTKKTPRPIIAGEIADRTWPLSEQSRLTHGAKLTGEHSCLQRESSRFDNEVKTNECRFFSEAIYGDHLLQLAIIEGGRFFEVNGNASLNTGAVHLCVQRNWCWHNEKVELVAADMKHVAIIGKNLHTSPGKLEGLLLG